jgi:hypothetical protein
LAKLAKLRERNFWCRRIWQSLARYANTGDGTGTSPQQVQDFQKLASNGMDWIGGVDDDIRECLDVKGGASLKVLATRYRPDIRRILTWLSAPDRHRELAPHAVNFLRLHGTGIKMHLEGNPSFDATETGGPLVFEWPDLCVSVVSPVCKFILDQIELHDPGKKQRDVIPIGMCERPGCGGFFVIERVGRGRFCSSKCRAGAYQDKMTREEKAARMRKYRERIKQLKRKPIRFAKRRGANVTYKR